MAQAARYWNCPAWELETRPDAAYYISRALMFLKAENDAQEIAREIEAKRTK